MASHFHETSFQVFLEVINLSRMNWGVFVAGLGQKYFKIILTSEFLLVGFSYVSKLGGSAPLRLVR